MNIIKSTFILSAVFVSLFAASTKILAQTSDVTKGGEQIIQKDGVMYVSTELTATADAAQGTPSLSDVDIVVPPTYADNISDLVNFALRAVLAIAALLVFAYLLLGAFQWITSGGDKGKTEQARNQIIAAVIGLIIVAASYAIFNLVIGFLGFGSLENILDNVRTINTDPADIPGPQNSQLNTLQDVINATPSGTTN